MVQVTWIYLRQQMATYTSQTNPVATHRGSAEHLRDPTFQLNAFRVRGFSASNPAPDQWAVFESACTGQMSCCEGLASAVFCKCILWTQVPWSSKRSTQRSKRVGELKRPGHYGRISHFVLRRNKSRGADSLPVLNFTKWTFTTSKH